MIEGGIKYLKIPKKWQVASSSTNKLGMENGRNQFCEENIKNRIQWLKTKLKDMKLNITHELKLKTIKSGKCKTASYRVT